MGRGRVLEVLRSVGSVGVGDVGPGSYQLCEEGVATGKLSSVGCRWAGTVRAA